MKHKVTILLKNVSIKSHDEEKVREEVKAALEMALENDDEGVEELDFEIEPEDGFDDDF